jgi:hypothetical protein
MNPSVTKYVSASEEESSYILIKPGLRDDIIGEWSAKIVNSPSDPGIITCSTSLESSDFSGVTNSNLNLSILNPGF